MSDAPATTAPTSTSATDAATIPQSAMEQNFTGTKHKIDWEDGNAQELSYEDLISDYKMSKKEAMKLAKQQGPMLQFLQSLQNGDLNSLSHLVPQDKLLEFAEQALSSRLEWEQMDPSQRKLIEKEQELSERERRYKEYEAQMEAQAQEKVNQQALSQVQSDIVSAIQELGFDNTTNRPTPRLIRRVAEQLKAQIESNMPMDARKASKHEWNNITNELSEFQMMMLKKDPSKFVEGLPKEVRKAIRDYELNAGTPFKRAVVDKSDAPTPRGELRDFDYLESLYGDNRNKRRTR